jgi:hypothetical protein
MTRLQSDQAFMLGDQTVCQADAPIPQTDDLHYARSVDEWRSLLRHRIRHRVIVSHKKNPVSGPRLSSFEWRMISWARGE